jgi:hypothetical protein
VFAQGTILINREINEVFDALADLRRQMPIWDMIHVPNLADMDDGVKEVEGNYTLGHSVYSCIIELHLTRPPAGLVTHISWTSGELAAEWRIMQDGDRTRVEVNIEGRGGGLANNINLRQMTPKILNRLKELFDRA